MKKIIILNWVLKIFIALLILAVPINEVLRYNLSNEAITLMYKDSIFGNFSPYVMFLRIAILIFALFNIQKGLQGFIKEGFFNFKSSERFNRSGYLLLFLSVSGIIITLLGMNQSQEVETLSNIIIDLLLLAIGIGLLAFSDVIKKGNSIETENNLTI
ncbi:Protein of unknown function [Flavobacterium omnivorum]|uniref:DUF2975 domain-containing protein n=1 Tax=Flavobacterium omnivorum TaxID=178355 RepID=A0A1G7YVD2_9FLAO|nr:DUF2975 domain-containing protein [Flavobacterium omnivorum]SDH00305.1 Protein of unknown function [Flavobacterium omnivorum]